MQNERKTTSNPQNESTPFIPPRTLYSLVEEFDNLIGEDSVDETQITLITFRQILHRVRAKKRQEEILQKAREALAEFIATRDRLEEEAENNLNPNLRSEESPSPPPHYRREGLRSRSPSPVRPIPHFEEYINFQAIAVLPRAPSPRPRLPKAERFIQKRPKNTSNVIKKWHCGQGFHLSINENRRTNPRGAEQKTWQSHSKT